MLQALLIKGAERNARLVHDFEVRSKAIWDVSVFATDIL